MSTKIYNGYKFKSDPKNLKEARDILFKFKEQVIKHYEEKYFELVASDVVGIYDREMLGLEVYCKFPDPLDGETDHTIYDMTNSHRTLSNLVMDAVDRKSVIYREQSQRMHEYFYYDFYCNVTILPSNDKMFLMLYSEDKDVQEIFSYMDEIEEYCYYDNTDQPEGITCEQWKERGKEWDEALPGSGVPAKCGFGLDIVASATDISVPLRWRFTKEDPNPVDRVMHYLPKFDRRVKDMTRMIIRKEWDEANKDKYDDTVKASDYFAVSREFEKYYKDNADIVEKRKEEVSSKLKKDFTIDDMEIKAEDFCKKYGIEKR